MDMTLSPGVTKLTLCCSTPSPNAMPPKTLFLSPLYPFLSPLIPTKNNSIHVFLYNPKPLRIKCNKPPLSHSTTTFEPDGSGSGAAAPTRGDIFLGRQQAALEASAQVLLDSKKIRKQKKEKMMSGYGKASAVVYSCYGCGAPLQTFQTDAPGYVDTDTYQLVYNFNLVYLVAYLLLHT